MATASRGCSFFAAVHRGSSLEYGRIEEQGIRCCYHGWLYDVAGNVLDTPLEPPESTVKDHLKHPGYPVQEFGGLVFAYMGPLEKVPELPKYDAWMQEGGKFFARFGPRIGGSVDCNWLQAEENLMDALHTVWLHTLHSGSQFPTQVFTSLPEELRYEETDMGMRFVMKQKLDDGKWAELIWEMVMPLNAHLVYTDELKTTKVKQVFFLRPGGRYPYFVG